MITVLVIFWYRFGNHLDAYIKSKYLIINGLASTYWKFINSINI
jgi:hypothetical protein